ncbi:MAG: MoaD/ThiS family protein [Clostridiales bacterium]|nr:MoaD/ThiS family protein [Clostridiales bacterium]
MVKVEFFGIYRLSYKMSSWEVDAHSISDLLKKLSKKFPVFTYKELKNSVIMVNDVNFLHLKKYKTKLCDGDSVFIMSPASGG